MRRVAVEVRLAGGRSFRTAVCCAEAGPGRVRLDQLVTIPLDRRELLAAADAGAEAEAAAALAADLGTGGGSGGALPEGGFLTVCCFDCGRRFKDSPLGRADIPASRLLKSLRPPAGGPLRPPGGGGAGQAEGGWEQHILELRVPGEGQAGEQDAPQLVLWLKLEAVQDSVLARPARPFPTPSRLAPLQTHRPAPDPPARSRLAALLS